MNKNRFLKITNKYKSQLEDIISRFTESRDSLDINTEDDPIYRQKVIELIDLFNDNFNDTSYSDQIRHFFNEGVATFYQSPSYKSVENIIGVVGAVITRVERNPELLNRKLTSKSNNKKKDLESTEKVTLPWLMKNVSAPMWWKFLLLLIFVFCMGANSTAFQPVRDFLNIFPWYNISYKLPLESQKEIESQLEVLTNAHNQRLNDLQENLLIEEKLSADHNLFSVDREKHQQSAERIKSLIKDENENFSKELKLIKEFIQ